MGKIYNQTEDKYWRNACVPIGLLNIIKYKYGITVIPNFTMKLLIFFDELGTWSPDKGAIFDVLYRSFINQINKKLNLNFTVVKSTIYKIEKTDTGTYGVGAPNYSRAWYGPEDRGVITKKDVDTISQYKGKTTGHHLSWDGSKRGYMINTRGKSPFKCSLEVLRYMGAKGLLWTPVRTIGAVDQRTIQITQITKEMARQEIKGTLDEFIQKNKDQKYMREARGLFFFGRTN